MSVPGSSELENMANEAWERYHHGDKSVIDEIYASIHPFCLKVCAKTCGRYISDEDEETSIARIAVLEAFEKYEPEKGRFLLYLGRVIHNRIIDFKRKEKQKKSIFFSFLDLEREDAHQLVDNDLVNNVIEDLDRKQEIEKFKEILFAYEISLNDLINTGPKQQKTREKSKEIALLISEDIELTNYLLEKKNLPIKALQENYNVNRKLVDRYRKYIIASVLIHIYGFSSLKPYVMPLKGGKKND